MAILCRNNVLLFVVMVTNLYGSIQGSCLDGSGSDCVFPCHCRDQTRCGTDCRDDCETGKLGHNWEGPYCQIGNVGLGKEAWRSDDRNFGARGFNLARAALDGVIPNSTLDWSCARPMAKDTSPAEWWADLGDIYRILRIIVYGRPDGAQDELQQFELLVYNTTQDNEVECGSYDPIVYDPVTITCSSNTVGRYVHFRRYGGASLSFTAICEMVIIGYKYIACDDDTYGTSCQESCGNCVTGTTCDGLTGYCGSCQAGYYGKTCKDSCSQCKDATCDTITGYCVECPDIRYGNRCEHNCGHCKSEPCTRSDGDCPDGCQQWWGLNTCNEEIVLPERSSESVSPVEVTDESVHIRWDHIRTIHSQLKQYYGYYVTIETVNSDITRTVTFTGAEGSAEFTQLTANTNYTIIIVPFRRQDGHIDIGTAYPSLSFLTLCVDGTYGINCVDSCGYCVSGTTCNKMTGRCPQGCQDEWNGDQCRSHCPVRDSLIHLSLIGVLSALVLGLVIFIVVNHLHNKRQISRMREAKSENPDRPDIEMTPVGSPSIASDPADVQYEEASGSISKTSGHDPRPDHVTQKDASKPYEGFTDEARRDYENNTTTGPYATIGE